MISFEQIFALKTKRAWLAFWPLFASVGVGLAIIAWILLVPDRSRPWGQYIWLIIQIPPLLYLFIRVVLLRRLRRLAKRHKGALCFACNYPLAGLPDSGVCPECGVPYDIKYTKEQWSELFRDSNFQYGAPT